MESAPNRRRRVVPREQRLGDIVREASRLFSEKGYEQTTVDELAEAMGISIGGLYRYVTTKSDALVMVCDDIYTGLPEQLKHLLEDEADPDAALAAIVLRYLQSCVEHRELILLMYREFRHLPAAAQARSKAKERAIAALLATALERAQKGGMVKPGDTKLLAADILLLGHLPALKGWQLRRTGPGLSTFAERQSELLVAALRT